jgi:hypothetical protein
VVEERVYTLEASDIFNGYILKRNGCTLECPRASGSPNTYKKCGEWCPAFEVVNEYTTHYLTVATLSCFPRELRFFIKDSGLNG